MDAIFYPCMTYNLDEERATNHYNCRSLPTIRSF
ncbi:MAG: hypothetical protein ACLRVN_02050 [Butyricicoccus sp.]